MLDFASHLRRSARPYASVEVARLLELPQELGNANATAPYPLSMKQLSYRGRLVAFSTEEGPLLHVRAEHHDSTVSISHVEKNGP